MALLIYSLMAMLRRFTACMAGRQLFPDSKHFYLGENCTDASNCSNFLDLDCLSSSGNSCEEETHDR